MSLICERGHRPKAGSGAKCEHPMSGGRRCQNRLAEEPGVTWCDRCDRGLYAEGWCSFCGYPDPRMAEALEGDLSLAVTHGVQAYQTPPNVTSKPQVTGPQTAAQRQANSRSRALARKILKASAV